MNKCRHQAKGKAISFGEMEPEGNKGVLLRIAQKLDVQILKLFWCMGGSKGKRGH